MGTNENIDDSVSEIITIDEDIIVRPRKNIIASMAGEFRNELQRQVNAHPRQIIIDMTGVEMVDSVGIGVMIAVHNSLAKNGGKLKIIKADSNILNLFYTMRLNRHFTVEGTE